ncbi:hypothetical protein A0H81_13293 [Grifola frondosa]|uniref:Carboxylesterase type B domain-containing protein n=1 Tax=Grifola frondosa TaxID=5627 RepID=A0A1C7LQC0_GRIFR|nr:hypothetical protein A0H81_13293 [Grifola frondosa]
MYECLLGLAVSIRRFPSHFLARATETTGILLFPSTGTSVLAKRCLTGRRPTTCVKIFSKPRPASTVMKKYRRLVLLLVAGVATYFTISQTFLDLYKTAKLVHALRLLCAGFLTRTSLGTSNIVDLGYAQYAGNLTYPNAVAYLGYPLSLNTTRIGLASQGRIIDATQYPEFCVQGTTGSGEAGGAGSEDCLKVNIYAPAGTKKGDKLPYLCISTGEATPTVTLQIGHLTTGFIKARTLSPFRFTIA